MISPEQLLSAANRLCIAEQWVVINGHLCRAHGVNMATPIPAVGAMPSSHATTAASEDATVTATTTTTTTTIKDSSSLVDDKKEKEEKRVECNSNKVEEVKYAAAATTWLFKPSDIINTAPLPPTTRLICDAVSAMPLPSSSPSPSASSHVISSFSGGNLPDETTDAASTSVAESVGADDIGAPLLLNPLRERLENIGLLDPTYYQRQQQQRMLRQQQRQQNGDDCASLFEPSRVRREREAMLKTQLGLFASYSTPTATATAPTPYSSSTSNNNFFARGGGAVGGSGGLPWLSAVFGCLPSDGGGILIQQPIRDTFSLPSSTATSSTGASSDRFPSSSSASSRYAPPLFIDLRQRSPVTDIRTNKDLGCSTTTANARIITNFFFIIPTRPSISSSSTDESDLNTMRVSEASGPKKGGRGTSAEEAEGGAGNGLGFDEEGKEKEGRQSSASSLWIEAELRRNKFPSSARLLMTVYRSTEAELARLRRAFADVYHRYADDELLSSSSSSSEDDDGNESINENIPGTSDNNEKKKDGKGGKKSDVAVRKRNRRAVSPSIARASSSSSSAPTATTAIAPRQKESIGSTAAAESAASPDGSTAKQRRSRSASSYNRSLSSLEARNAKKRADRRAASLARKAAAMGEKMPSSVAAAAAAVVKRHVSSGIGVGGGGGGSLTLIPAAERRALRDAKAAMRLRIAALEDNMALLKESIRLNDARLASAREMLSRRPIAGRHVGGKMLEKLLLSNSTDPKKRKLSNKSEKNGVASDASEASSGDDVDDEDLFSYSSGDEDEDTNDGRKKKNGGASNKLKEMIKEELSLSRCGNLNTVADRWPPKRFGQATAMLEIVSRYLHSGGSDHVGIVAAAPSSATSAAAAAAVESKAQTAYNDPAGLNIDRSSTVASSRSGNNNEKTKRSGSNSTNALSSSTSLSFQSTPDGADAVKARAMVLWIQLIRWIAAHTEDHRSELGTSSSLDGYAVQQLRREGGRPTLVDEVALLSILPTHRTTAAAGIASREGHRLAAVWAPLVAANWDYRALPRAAVSLVAAASFGIVSSNSLKTKKKSHSSGCAQLPLHCHVMRGPSMLPDGLSPDRIRWLRLICGALLLTPLPPYLLENGDDSVSTTAYSGAAAAAASSTSNKRRLVTASSSTSLLGGDSIIDSSALRQQHYPAEEEAKRQKEAEEALLIAQRRIRRAAAAEQKRLNIAMAIFDQHEAASSTNHYVSSATFSGCSGGGGNGGLIIVGRDSASSDVAKAAARGIYFDHFARSLETMGACISEAASIEAKQTHHVVSAQPSSSASSATASSGPTVVKTAERGKKGRGKKAEAIDIATTSSTSSVSSAPFSSSSSIPPWATGTFVEIPIPSSLSAVLRHMCRLNSDADGSKNKEKGDVGSAPLSSTGLSNDPHGKMNDDSIVFDKLLLPSALLLSPSNGRNNSSGNSSNDKNGGGRVAANGSSAVLMHLLRAYLTALAKVDGRWISDLGGFGLLGGSSTTNSNSASATTTLFGATMGIVNTNNSSAGGVVDLFSRPLHEVYAHLSTFAARYDTPMVFYHLAKLIPFAANRSVFEGVVVHADGPLGGKENSSVRPMASLQHGSNMNDASSPLSLSPTIDWRLMQRNPSAMLARLRRLRVPPRLRGGKEGEKVDGGRQLEAVLGGDHTPLSPSDIFRENVAKCVSITSIDAFIHENRSAYGPATSTASALTTASPSAARMLMMTSGASASSSSFDSYLLDTGRLQSLFWFFIKHHWTVLAPLVCRTVVMTRPPQSQQQQQNNVHLQQQQQLCPRHVFYIPRNRPFLDLSSTDFGATRKNLDPRVRPEFIFPTFAPESKPEADASDLVASMGSGSNSSHYDHHGVMDGRHHNHNHHRGSQLLAANPHQIFNNSGNSLQHKRPAGDLGLLSTMPLLSPAVVRRLVLHYKTAKHRGDWRKDGEEGTSSDNYNYYSSDGGYSSSSASSAYGTTTDDESAASAAGRRQQRETGAAQKRGRAASSASSAASSSINNTNAANSSTNGGGGGVNSGSKMKKGRRHASSSASRPREGFGLSALGSKAKNDAIFAEWNAIMRRIVGNVGGTGKDSLYSMMMKGANNDDANNPPIVHASSAPSGGYRAADEAKRQSQPQAPCDPNRVTVPPFSTTLASAAPLRRDLQRALASLIAVSDDCNAYEAALEEYRQKTAVSVTLSELDCANNNVAAPPRPPELDRFSTRFREAKCHVERDVLMLQTHGAPRAIVGCLANTNPNNKDNNNNKNTINNASAAAMSLPIEARFAALSVTDVGRLWRWLQEEHIAIVRLRREKFQLLDDFIECIVESYASFELRCAAAATSSGVTNSDTTAAPHPLPSFSAILFDTIRRNLSHRISIDAELRLLFLLAGPSRLEIVEIAAEVHQQASRIHNHVMAMSPAAAAISRIAPNNRSAAQQLYYYFRNNNSNNNNIDDNGNQKRLTTQQPLEPSSAVVAVIGSGGEQKIKRRRGDHNSSAAGNFIPPQQSQQRQQPPQMVCADADDLAVESATAKAAAAATSQQHAAVSSSVAANCDNNDDDDDADNDVFGDDVFGDEDDGEAVAPASNSHPIAAAAAVTTKTNDDGVAGEASSSATEDNKKKRVADEKQRQHALKLAAAFGMNNDQITATVSSGKEAAEESGGKRETKKARKDLLSLLTPTRPTATSAASSFDNKTNSLAVVPTAVPSAPSSLFSRAALIELSKTNAWTASLRSGNRIHGGVLDDWFGLLHLVRRRVVADGFVEPVSGTKTLSLDGAASQFDNDYNRENEDEGIELEGTYVFSNPLSKRRQRADKKRQQQQQQEQQESLITASSQQQQQQGAAQSVVALSYLSIRTFKRQQKRSLQQRMSIVIDDDNDDVDNVNATINADASVVDLTSASPVASQAAAVAISSLSPVERDIDGKRRDGKRDRTNDIPHCSDLSSTATMPQYLRSLINSNNNNNNTTNNGTPCAYSDIRTRLSCEEFAAAEEIWMPVNISNEHWVLFCYKRKGPKKDKKISSSKNDHHQRGLDAASNDDIIMSEDTQTPSGKQQQQQQQNTTVFDFNQKGFRHYITIYDSLNIFERADALDAAAERAALLGSGVVGGGRSSVGSAFSGRSTSPATASPSTSAFTSPTIANASSLAIGVANQQQRRASLSVSPAAEGSRGTPRVRFGASAPSVGSVSGIGHLSPAAAAALAEASSPNASTAARGERAAVEKFRVAILDAVDDFREMLVSFGNSTCSSSASTNTTDHYCITPSHSAPTTTTKSSTAAAYRFDFRAEEWDITYGKEIEQKANDCGLHVMYRGLLLALKLKSPPMAVPIVASARTATAASSAEAAANNKNNNTRDSSGYVMARVAPMLLTRKDVLAVLYAPPADEVVERLSGVVMAVVASACEEQ